MEGGGREGGKEEEVEDVVELGKTGGNRPIADLTDAVTGYLYIGICKQVSLKLNDAVDKSEVVAVKLNVDDDDVGVGMGIGLLVSSIEHFLFNGWV